MPLKNVLLTFAVLAPIASGFNVAMAADIASGLKLTDEYTLVGDKNFLADFQPKNRDGTINVIVEIPTGSVAKWEVSKEDGSIKWEFKNGKPREVKFLGYPGNYGMIPRTLLSKEGGGDGDPLDVIVIGKAVPRGSVVKAHIIGVLKLLDGGEVDDKILAVSDSSAMSAARSPSDLSSKFPGVLPIIETWFESYKGSGEIESNGFAGPEEARKVIDAAISAYRS